MAEQFNVHVKIPFPEITEKDTVAEGTRVKACFEVTAGVVPFQPMPEYTRRWIITSEAWEKDLEATKEVRGMTIEDFKKWHAAGNRVDTTFIRFRDAAYDYAKEIINPTYVNWVRVDWIWM